MAILGSFIRGFEKVAPHRRNPGEYLNVTTGGVILLVMKEFAPLSERLTSILGRVREVPRVLEEAKENLVPDEVPRVWAETALEQAQQAPLLFTALLPRLAQGAAPGLVDELSTAGRKAGEAVEDYAAFIRDEILPNAEGDFAIGKDLFDEILREEQMVDYDTDELLKIGWERLRATEKMMDELAREIDPDRSAREILDEAKGDHPNPERLLATYEEAMRAARDYVVENGIATLPPGEFLRIVETPVYLRPIIPYAAYMPPGIFEEKQEGIFVVTPVDPDASDEEKEAKLRGHSSMKIPVTAIHEAYPGHHLQLTWANRAETVPRRMGSFLATMFIEGWAFYCEELMEELGYILEPIQRLGRLSDQLWRAARIILDVSLHTRGMTVKEGIDFLVERCGLEPANAAAEVKRYTMTPTQPQSYLMGKLQILELIEEFKRENPTLGLREVHDAILSSGSLPIRLMRRALLGGPMST
ncbi:hypothetical protein DRJ12_04270 [Candidatus Acetothermia bacterium]|nr:MAG: hypothetical protein DRJ12_04270 [Candidatus Acetothermia bacterium]